MNKLRKLEEQLLRALYDHVNSNELNTLDINVQIRPDAPTVVTVYNPATGRVLTFVSSIHDKLVLLG